MTPGALPVQGMQAGQEKWPSSSCTGLEMSQGPHTSSAQAMSKNWQAGARTWVSCRQGSKTCRTSIAADHAPNGGGRLHPPGLKWGKRMENEPKDKMHDLYVSSPVSAGVLLVDVKSIKYS